MAVTKFTGRTIFPGEANGPALVLSQPISFWGGVSPQSGKIIHPSHPQCGIAVGHQILFLPGTIGSSSSSAIILELCRIGLAPRAIVMHKTDAILSLGIVVAREMGYQTCPVVELDPHKFSTGQWVTVTADQDIATLEYKGA